MSWAPLAVSAVVTAIAAPVVTIALMRSGRLDVPNHRSSHSVPTPRGGGIACFLGVVGGAAAAQSLGLPVPYLGLTVCLLVGLVGFLDDQYTLPAIPRLAAQVSLGCVAGWSTGLPVLSLLGALIFPIVVNAVNFMDGINGITGMVGALWGVTAAYLGQVDGVPHLTVLGLVTAGACLGFLPFNALKARLFLGDVGSYLFGGLAGAGAVIGIAGHVSITSLLAPFALYFLDVFLTLGRRARAGESLTTAHRDHVYQRLVARGLEHIQVAALVLGLSAIITAGWVFLPTGMAVLSTVLASASYVLLPEFLSSRTSQRV